MLQSDFGLFKLAEEESIAKSALVGGQNEQRTGDGGVAGNGTWEREGDRERRS